MGQDRIRKEETLISPLESVRRWARFFAVAALLSGGCSDGDPGAWSPPPLDLYATNYIGAVFRSLNGGIHWLPLGSDPLPLMAYRKTLALGDDGAVYVGTSGGGLYTLDRDDAPYRKCGLDLRSGHVRAVHHGSVDRRLWVGTAESGVFTSTDGGATWTPRNDGLTTYRVNCLVAHPDDPDAVYCGTDAGLLNNQGGGRWTSVGGLAGVDIQALVILPGTGRMLAGAAWVGSGTNLFSSEDGGTHWEPVDRGLPRASVFCLAYDESGDRVLAGTSVGVFQLASDKSRWVRLGRNLNDVRVFSLAAAEGIGYAATGRGLFGIAPGSNRWVDLGLGPTRSAVTDVVVRSVSRPVPES